MTSSSGWRHRPPPDATSQSDRVKLAAIYAFVIESYKRREAAGVTDGETSDIGSDGPGHAGAVPDQEGAS
jgi:hypothetical protein